MHRPRGYHLCKFEFANHILFGHFFLLCRKESDPREPGSKLVQDWILISEQGLPDIYNYISSVKKYRTIDTKGYPLGVLLLCLSVIQNPLKSNINVIIPHALYPCHINSILYYANCLWYYICITITFHLHVKH